MENYNKFMETVNLFKKDLGNISKAETFDALSDLEKKCVHELQLIIVEAEMCGRDLKAAVDKRQAELRA